MKYMDGRSVRVGDYVMALGISGIKKVRSIQHKKGIVLLEGSVPGRVVEAPINKVVLRKIGNDDQGLEGKNGYIKVGDKVNYVVHSQEIPCVVDNISYFDGMVNIATSEGLKTWVNPKCLVKIRNR